jgi:hypothetical protein
LAGTLRVRVSCQRLRGRDPLPDGLTGPERVVALPRPDVAHRRSGARRCPQGGGVHCGRLLRENARYSAVDLDLGSKTRSSCRRRGWSDQPGRERELLGLNDDGISRVALLTAASVSGPAQPMHLTTHEGTSCHAGPVQPLRT